MACAVRLILPHPLGNVGVHHRVTGSGSPPQILRQTLRSLLLQPLFVMQPTKNRRRFDAVAIWRRKRGNFAKLMPCGTWCRLRNLERVSWQPRFMGSHTFDRLGSTPLVEAEPTFSSTNSLVSPVDRRRLLTARCGQSEPDPSGRAAVRNVELLPDPGTPRVWPGYTVGVSGNVREEPPATCSSRRLSGRYGQPFFARRILGSDQGRRWSMPKQLAPTTLLPARSTDAGGRPVGRLKPERRLLLDSSLLVAGRVCLLPGNRECGPDDGSQHSREGSDVDALPSAR